MSKKLDTIRTKIDKLDNAIHDTLMERAALISSIAAEKKKSGLDYVQPAREAQMLRRLLARHDGALPPETIVRIWRELVGSVSLMQTGLSISVCIDNDQDFIYWEMVRNYFGSVVPMNRVSSALLTLSALREDTAAFAVFPWVRDIDLHDDGAAILPWWAHLFNQEQNQGIKIVCALPYGVIDHADGSKTSPTGALVLSKTAFMPSDDDNSFMLLEINRETSRAKLVDALETANLTPISIHTAHHGTGTDDGTTNGSGKAYHIIEVAGYITDDTSHADDFCTALDDTNARCICVGGYPVPPIFPKDDNKAVK